MFGCGIRFTFTKLRQNGKASNNGGNPRLRSQIESRYAQTVPDGKCLCPDCHAYIRLFVRSCSDVHAFFRVSRQCKFERKTPPSCGHLVLDISTFRLGPQPGMGKANKPLGRIFRLVRIFPGLLQIFLVQCYNRLQSPQTCISKYHIKPSKPEAQNFGRLVQVTPY